MYLGCLSSIFCIDSRSLRNKPDCYGIALLISYGIFFRFLENALCRFCAISRYVRSSSQSAPWRREGFDFFCVLSCLVQQGFVRQIQNILWREGCVKNQGPSVRFLRIRATCFLCPTVSAQRRSIIRIIPTRDLVVDSIQHFRHDSLPEPRNHTGVEGAVY